MRYILKLLIAYIARLLLMPFLIFPVRKNRILFDSYNGDRIGCNPYYIYTYLKRNFPDLELIWVIKNKEILKDEDVSYVILNTLKYFYIILTSKVYIRNTLIPAHIPFRKNQIRINTWHGGGAYKGTMYSVNRKIGRKQVNAMIAKTTTKTIASCAKFVDYFHSDLLVDTSTFLRIGMPRNDIFFDKVLYEERSSVIRNHYSIDKNSYVVLYAPTFRSDAHNPQFNVVIDYDLLASAVKKRFARSKIVILFRGHHTFRYIQKPSVSQSSELSKISFIDTSDYQNTQDLLCATDMLISDYSSIIWDYSYTYRPCFLYIPDMKEYTSRYELITPIEEWGYPTATSMQELYNLILSYREEEYISRIKNNHEILGSYEQGNATKKFCDYLIPEIAKS